MGPDDFLLLEVHLLIEEILVAEEPVQDSLDVAHPLQGHPHLQVLILEFFLLLLHCFILLSQLLLLPLVLAYLIGILGNICIEICLFTRQAIKLMSQLILLGLELMISDKYKYGTFVYIRNSLTFPGTVTPRPISFGL